MKLFHRPKANGEAKPNEPRPVETGVAVVPDYHKMMRTGIGDAKGHALDKLLRSDDSNAIKAIIHNVFNMSVMDAMSRWEEFDSEEELLQTFLNGRIGEMEGGYRINTMAEDGIRSEQYVRGFMAWTLMVGPAAQVLNDSRLKEGNKK